MLPAAPQGGPTIVTVFNHKGGVGKTTTTFSLGWKLASTGNRVLLVDADPQCNLSGFLIDPGFDLITPANVQGSLVDPLERFYREIPRSNIRAALAPLLGDNTLQQQLGVQNGELIAEPFQVSHRNHFLPPNVAPFSSGNVPPSLYLLAGHPQFYEYEAMFSNATENPLAFPNAANVPGCIHHLCQRMHQTAVNRQDGVPHNGFDYIIFDLSPSVSVTNKLVLMSSTCFIVPCSPDFFSHMAIDSLCKILTSWDQWKALAVNTAGAQWRMPRHKPIFLGHTIQIFTLSSDGTGEPAAAFLRWIQRIQETMSSKLVRALQKRGMALPETAYMHPMLGATTELTRIRNLQSVGPASTKCHVPAFALEPRLLELAGAKSSSNARIIEEYNDSFNTISYLVAARWRRLPYAQQEQIRNLQEAYSLLQTIPVPQITQALASASTNDEILRLAQVFRTSLPQAPPTPVYNVDEEIDSQLRPTVIQ